MPHSGMKSLEGTTERRRPDLRKVLVASLGLSLFALGACGGAAPAASSPPSSPASTPAAAAASPASSSAATVTAVSLRLPWLSTGEDAPFYQAVADGAYKAAGLDVTIEPGTSSLLTAETVASGKDTFGFADATSVAGIISKGAKEQMVAQVVDTSPVGIIHRNSLDLTSATQLKGMTILSNSSGGPVIGLLDAALDADHMAKTDVHLDIVAASAEASSFAVHSQYLLTGYCNSTFLSAAALVPASSCTVDSKLAPINALSFGIVTSSAEMQAHPAVVRAFVATTIKAWQQAQANPDQIAPSALKEAQSLDQHPPALKTWTLSLTQTLADLNQPAGEPFGYADASMWSSTLSVLHKYAGLKTVLPTGDYYTNSFLPAS